MADDGDNLGKLIRDALGIVSVDVPISCFQKYEWRVLPCVWHWSVDRDIICVRADAERNACRTSDGFRALSRSSGNAATGPRSRAAIGRFGTDRASGRHHPPI